jgi:two-component system phosphate regulon response regulator PhoB
MAAEHLHILLVDDNQEILDMLGLMLGRYSFIVSAQSRVGDFISEVRTLAPDLIIMDQNLGWANGCDLCAMIKTDAALQHIPVIMLSAYHKLKEDCLFAGADVFVEKPFEMKTLLTTIKTIANPEKVYWS